LNSLVSFIRSDAETFPSPSISMRALEALAPLSASTMAKGSRLSMRQLASISKSIAKRVLESSCSNRNFRVMEMSFYESGFHKVDSQRLTRAHRSSFMIQKIET